jgi:hypothetical protein
MVRLFRVKLFREIFSQQNFEKYKLTLKIPFMKANTLKKWRILAFARKANYYNGLKVAFLYFLVSGCSPGRAVWRCSTGMFKS